MCNTRYNDDGMYNDEERELVARLNLAAQQAEKEKIHMGDSVGLYEKIEQKMHEVQDENVHLDEIIAEVREVLRAAEQRMDENRELVRRLEDTINYLYGREDDLDSLLNDHQTIIRVNLDR